ncbi:MAG: CinA family protein [Ruminococcaceae bacterium]|nr:CinA family protein [Oscillospiraceae bacterium]
MNSKVLLKAEELVNLLKQKNLKIATAESCTGGMISTYITAVSGASGVFEMGITSYSNRIKNKILKVNADTLETQGAVSFETAKQMAQNIREISGADIGVSVTGVAGPASQEGRPVGTVFVGFSFKDKTTAKLLNIEPLGREFIREQAVLNIFTTAIEILNT